MKDPERYRKWKEVYPNGSREQYKHYKAGLNKKDVMQAMMAAALPNLSARAGTVKKYDTFEEFASEFQGAKPWEFKAYQKHPRMFLAWKAEKPIQHQKSDFQAFARAHGGEVKEDEPADDSQMILDKEGRQSIRNSQASFRKNALRLRNRYFTSSEPEPPHSITSTVRPKLTLTHIHEPVAPVSIPPDELNRAIGRIEGLEEDGRLWNAEKDKYLSAWKLLGVDVDKVPHKKHIHATRLIRQAVSELTHSDDSNVKRMADAIVKRLVSW